MAPLISQQTAEDHQKSEESNYGEKENFKNNYKCETESEGERSLKGL